MRSAFMCYLLVHDLRANPAHNPSIGSIGSMNLGLAQETRDYVRTTREQFIAAYETNRMDVGR
jgi:hypothetical protein